VVAVEDKRWGALAVDPDEKSLPGLKARYLVKHTPDRGTVLDVGCGEGKFLRTLAREKPELSLIGCDIQEPANIDCFEFRPIKDGIPAPDASVDVVLLFDVLEHVPDPGDLLSDAKRVLRPDGVLVAFVPIEGETFSAYTLYKLLLGKDTYVDTKEHIQAFSHRALGDLVKKRFSLEDWTYAYHAFGHVMDASFFAAQKLNALRRFWWQDNRYYAGGQDEERESSMSAASRVLNLALGAANAVAWAESSALANVRFLSAGALFSARKS
jgi:SAM-dependent methyltransferase